MKSLNPATFLLVALALLVSANPYDQAGAAFDYGTFNDPSAPVRPRFRYWLPDASVDKNIVAADIESSASIGADCVEFLPFYNYGGGDGAYTPGLDWVTYGFGTPAYLDIFRTAIQAHKDNDLVMDFALGPNQGQGVPANADDDGLQWDLVSTLTYLIIPETNVTSDGYLLILPFHSTALLVIPGWGTGELVALISALVLSKTKVTEDLSSYTGNSAVSYLNLTLSHDSLTDHTSCVSPTGHVSLSFAQQSSGIENHIFAFYQTKTLHKNLEFPNNKTQTIWDVGSYIVDHYSPKGARVVADFLEQYVFPNGVKELMMDVGNYGWEDSIEMKSNISWTPAIPERTKAKFGYDIRPYLPIIMWGEKNINVQSTDPGSIRCAFDSEDAGRGYINDFRSTLEDLYREYIQELTKWLNESLGLQSSAQISYNLPMDMAVNIPFVNAPECESLQFRNSIDAYRQFAGAAQLAGKRVISNEMGAEAFKAYALTIPHLLFDVARAVAGGVNQVVLHGQTYTGNCTLTTWPGYTSFPYVFAEMYSKKQPAWDHGFSDALNYIARIQHIQQQGIPRTDVAIYNKVSATDTTFPTVYQSSDLMQHGKLKPLLTPDNFKLPQARVENGLLSPIGPAYKALVLPDKSNLTSEAIDSLKDYADAGLPIIIGYEIGYYPLSSTGGQAKVEASFAKLKERRNVYTVGNSTVANTLHSIGLSPRISVRTNGTWYTTWRTTESIDYAFIHCDNLSAHGQVQVLNTKTPYFFDAWTGEKTAVLNYDVVGDRTVIPLSLAGNQSLIIAFADSGLDDAVYPHFHVTSLPSNVIGYEFTKSDELVLKVDASSTEYESSNVVLSNGKTHAISSRYSISPSFSLQNWNLTAEHWEAPPNMDDASVIGSKRNTTHTLSSLVSWDQIPALTNASGIGYYSTSITWPSFNGTADSAYITFSEVLHTLRLYVNGQKLPPPDVNAARADLGPYLKEGRNEILVVVPTTMWNYLRSIFGELLQAGYPPSLESMGALPDKTQNGLVGEVVITPYFNVVVRG
ncbi:hypothetical protein K490DRAFT_36539 [Saccharata proteae CBS 121410]|uniref:Glycoside hydrolase family 2 protein n=1 Tax=Saccharata proteae CBS 121410 TaxID=1314787 RepID=A0A9P4M0I5_9PEZI|nr:hypothetical protein K490DRAFT_36539 [Saccharata proteae CBS 121410]